MWLLGAPSLAVEVGDDSKESRAPRDDSAWLRTEHVIGVAASSEQLRQAEEAWIAVASAVGFYPSTPVRIELNPDDQLIQIVEAVTIAVLARRQRSNVIFGVGAYVSSDSIQGAGVLSIGNDGEHWRSILIVSEALVNTGISPGTIAVWVGQVPAFEEWKRMVTDSDPTRRNQARSLSVSWVRWMAGRGVRVGPVLAGRGWRRAWERVAPEPIEALYAKWADDPHRNAVLIEPPPSSIHVDVWPSDRLVFSPKISPSVGVIVDPRGVISPYGGFEASFSDVRDRLRFRAGLTLWERRRWSAAAASRIGPIEVEGWGLVVEGPLAALDEHGVHVALGFDVGLELGRSTRLEVGAGVNNLDLGEDRLWSRSLRAGLRVDTREDTDIPRGFYADLAVEVSVSETEEDRWFFSRPSLGWQHRIQLFRLRSGDGPVLMMGGQLLWTLGETHVIEAAAVGGIPDPTVPAGLVDAVLMPAWGAGEAAPSDVVAVATIGAWVPLSPLLNVAGPVAPTRVFLAVQATGGWLEAHSGARVHPLFGSSSTVDPSSDLSRWIWGAHGRLGLLADVGGQQGVVAVGLAGPGRFRSDVRAVFELGAAW